MTTYCVKIKPAFKAILPISWPLRYACTTPTTYCKAQLCSNFNVRRLESISTKPAPERFGQVFMLWIIQEWKTTKRLAPAYRAHPRSTWIMQLTDQIPCHSVKHWVLPKVKVWFKTRWLAPLQKPSSGCHRSWNFPMLHRNETLISIIEVYCYHTVTERLLLLKNAMTNDVKRRRRLSQDSEIIYWGKEMM